MKIPTLLSTLLMACLIASCGGSSRKAEIAQRRQALQHKQDSALAEAQQEMGRVDSLLQAAKADCAEMEARVGQHRDELTATAEELTALTHLKLHRDSLEQKWQMLGAKIRYIREQQQKARKAD